MGDRGGPVAPGASREQELSLLYRVAEALNRCANVSEALEQTLDLLGELLGLSVGWVWLRQGPGGEFYLAATRNLPAALRERPDLMRGSGSCVCLDRYGRAEDGEAANINLLECSRLKPVVAAAGGLRFHASLPLRAGDRLVGVMNVVRPSWQELTAEELRLLETVGYQVAVAVERSRLAEETARLARAEERNRLAREIHDSIAQGLAGIALQLEVADATLSAEPDRSRQHVLRALDLVRETLEEARRSVHDLRVRAVEEMGLAPALEQLAARLCGDAGLQLSVVVDPDLGMAAPAVQAALYRVAQEGLVNVSRHAAASVVRLRLSREGAEIVLRIEDDGRGFDPAAAASLAGLGHFGLVGMRERLEVLGGRLEIHSAPGRGTRLRAAIPLEAA